MTPYVHNTDNNRILSYNFVDQLYDKKIVVTQKCLMPETVKSS
jgi:hypothetical protein